MSDWRRSNWTWQQKRSLFVFLLCNVILLLTYFLFPTLYKGTILELDTPKIQSLLIEIETKEKENSVRTQPTKFPFNPNYITDYQAYLFSDRKSTRLNSSHVAISYAVFCLKKKKLYHSQFI